MSAWRGIVFDLDDTLYPERDYVLSGFRAVAAWASHHLGLPAEQGFSELRSLFERGVRGDTFDRWLGAHGLAPYLAKQLVSVYREHQPVLVPFAGVADLLDALGEKHSLGLLTDGYLAVQRRKLAALDLAHHFDAAVFSDELGREAWKPSPEPYREILDRLGMASSEAVYVADNPLKDFLGARRVGMSTVRFRCAGGEYARLEPPTCEHAPDAEVSSIDELRQTFW